MICFQLVGVGPSEKRKTYTSIVTASSISRSPAGDSANADATKANSNARESTFIVLSQFVEDVCGEIAGE